MTDWQRKIHEAIKDVIEIDGTIEVFWSDRWSNHRSNPERSGYPTVIICRDIKGSPFKWIESRSSSKSGASHMLDIWEDNIQYSEIVLCKKVRRYLDEG